MAFCFVFSVISLNCRFELVCGELWSTHSHCIAHGKANHNAKRKDDHAIHMDSGFNRINPLCYLPQLPGKAWILLPLFSVILSLSLSLRFFLAIYKEPSPFNAVSVIHTHTLFVHSLNSLFSVFYYNKRNANGKISWNNIVLRM